MTGGVQGKQRQERGARSWDLIGEAGRKGWAGKGGTGRGRGSEAAEERWEVHGGTEG